MTPSMAFAAKLLRAAAYEAENPLELSLRQAFSLVERSLRPPFPLSIPTPEEYRALNRAILYGILTEPHHGRAHIKHLHAVVSDGYAFFVSLLVRVVCELLDKLVDSARAQLVWVTREMVDVSAVGFDELLVSLLRQIVGGDFSDGNLRLCSDTVSIFLSKWDCLLEEEPLILTSGLYVFLRLLGDHCRVSSSDSKLEALVRLEIEFCVKMLREQFGLCLKIGRDVIRLLQDLVHVPEFRAVWKDLVLNPSEFGASGFTGIAQIYSTRTSSRYFLLRIPPLMETYLRFLLTQVKLGGQKRHQAWFASKYLSSTMRETLIIDVIRFICCGHHPTAELIQSDIIPRWAVIGWLLNSCRKSYVAANAKLALFYDWLFFDERVDKVMNIEPAMLLMVYSVPKYANITNSLLEFLFLLVDNYDVEYKELITRGVLSSFSSLISKGVIQNLEVLTLSGVISPPLRERLAALLLGKKGGIPNEVQAVNVSDPCLPAPEFRDSSCHGAISPSPKQQYRDVREDQTGSKPVHSTVATRTRVDDLGGLAQNLGVAMKQSDRAGFSLLQEILDLFVSIEKLPASGPNSTRSLCTKITKDSALHGHRLFKPLCFFPNETDSENQVESVTSIIIRKFVFQKERMQEMLSCWAMDGFPVGACLLSYASRLSYEANKVDDPGNSLVSDSLPKLEESQVLLLKFHANCYHYPSNSKNKKHLEAVDSLSDLDRELVAEVINDVFIAYKSFLEHQRSTLHGNEADQTLSKLLLYDLTCCSTGKGKSVKFLFRSIFSHLRDLSVCDEQIIRLLIGCLDGGDVLDVEFDIGLRRLSIFGESTEAILSLIKRSLNWEPIEQHKFWGFLRLELSVSQVQIDKLISNFFWSVEIKDPTLCSIAVGGLLSVCSSQAPTPELLGAVILLPNHVFEDFAAAVLSMWAQANAPMLFDSLAEISEKLKSHTVGEGIFPKHADITVNHSAVLWLLNYVSTRGLNLSNVLGSSFFSCITGGKGS